MLKKEIKPEIDEISLQVANDIRPLLENNLNMKFYRFVPSVYPDENHHPDKGSFSLCIIIDSNKTIYVTVIKEPEGSENKYHVLKLKVYP